ncbi:hypothetical protein [Paraglaciecola sp. MB-3u-78]|uniref:hypothetical protein n=1 Tax=Paraglaciecola sp. MB-3u-78 TaxID=2058332 RepID=UPI000C322769|nr:hypothetical protein [Paraglaciecola sp. MB-3u-78]PKG99794.1 hypothetical protein CXF95_10650 [Paraglaciecola sp. MB-3u-78]
MLKKIIFILIFTIQLSACDKSPPKQGGGKFGMLDTGNPEFAAIEFFEHIYSDKGLEGALKLSTPKMERLLRSYHTNKGAQKHVLNMRFDKVSIQSKSRSAGRNEFAKEAQISLFFEGELDGDILKDIRVIELVKIGNDWKVDDVSLN